MNQEELDTLIGDDEIFEDDMYEDSDEAFEDDTLEFDNENSEEENNDIMPPPADNKHKVVAQLDEVTKESEEKATQILDIMDGISNNTEKNIDSLKEVLSFLQHHQILFQKLHNKFPHIKTFEKELDDINLMIEKIKNITDVNEATLEEIFGVMDIMQYQDIHRQKIERVINIMRALIKYMNKLFEGNIEDEKRAKSANYIHGDEHEEALSDDDIEALLEQFGV